MDKNELLAASEVAEKVAGLYDDFFALSGAHGQEGDDGVLTSSVEAISNREADAESCVRQVKACRRALGVVYVEMKGTQNEFQGQCPDDFIVKWAAERCQQMASWAKGVIDLEQKEPGFDQSDTIDKRFREFCGQSDEIDKRFREFWDQSVFVRVDELCHRVSQIAYGLAHLEAEEAVIEEDGPVGHFKWRHEGVVSEIEMHSLAWRMVNHLWQCRGKQGNFSDLAEPVYGDEDHEVGGQQITSLRTAANRFFIKANIPWRVSCKKYVAKLNRP